MHNNKNNNKEDIGLSTRAYISQIIFAMLEQGKSLSSLIPQYQKKIASIDHGFMQEVCYGVARYLPNLQYITEQLLDRPIPKKFKIVDAVLYVGLYQLIYMRVPDHAAVDATVEASHQLKLEKFSALINAVLRNFLRKKDALLQQLKQRKDSLHPEWLTNKLKYAYPDNWQEIIEVNNYKPPMWIRVNPAIIEANQYLIKLQENGIEATLGMLPNSILLKQAVTTTKLPMFELGAVSVQDLNAQYASVLLEPKDNEEILDACAAPGGKTTHILELAPNTKLTALELEENRVFRIKENLARLNQQADVICGDARHPKLYFKGKLFDKILVDAPCSATGIIRRHPDIKWLRKEKDIQKLHILQLEILTALWTYLKVGGTLLYTTCSVLPDENYRVIKEFLSKTDNCKLITLDNLGKINVPLGVQLLPTMDGGDGFFFAKLIKNK